MASDYLKLAMDPVFHGSLYELQQSAEELAALGGRALKALEDAMSQGHVVRQKTLAQVWRDLEDAGFVHVREKFDICGTEYTITPSLFGEEAAEFLWEMRESDKNWPM